MSIKQAVLSDLSIVKKISEVTISEIYPHYYPKGAVDFFLTHHSEANILSDIRLNRVFLCLDTKQNVVGTVTIKTNEERPEIFVDNPFVFMPASENYAKYNTTLLNSINDFILQVMAGTRSVNDVSRYMNDWKNNGGELVRTDLQNYIDAQ